MNTTTQALVYLEFYREDGSWIGSAAANTDLRGEFRHAARVVFEGRVELVTWDENGDEI